MITEKCDYLFACNVFARKQFVTPADDKTASEPFSFVFTDFISHERKKTPLA